MNNQHNIKLIATDLDGTLLKNNKSISAMDHMTLDRLGKKGIFRVAATGRSLFKVNDVLPVATPIDFVVFSSGGGIFDWNNKKLLQSENFDNNTLKNLCDHLQARDFNFFVYFSIPNNNLFLFHQGAGYCNEFNNYLERHLGDFRPLIKDDLPDQAGQIMAIIPNNGALFERLKAEIHRACSRVKVIRTTSPINPDYLWLEIFPDTVSKGHGLKWLCHKLNIDPKFTVGIGNDYNDLDMFEFVEHAYILNNAVDELKQDFNNIGFSNEESGFSVVVEKLGI